MIYHINYSILIMVMITRYYVVKHCDINQTEILKNYWIFIIIWSLRFYFKSFCAQNYFNGCLRRLRYTLITLSNMILLLLFES